MARITIVPIDLSQQEAGARALARARQYDPEAKLVLLHVTAPVPSVVALDIPSDFLKTQVEKVEAALAEFADRNGVAGTADVVIRDGHAGREILTHAEEIGADLIAIASHDPSWGDFLLGSVAAFVVRHAHCSVLVVREPAGKRPK